MLYLDLSVDSQKSTQKYSDSSPENLQGKCHHNTFTRGVNEREKHRAI